MSLGLRRYHPQSPKNQSAFVLSTRNTPSKQKLAPLNVSSSLSKNPQIDLKLPSLSRSSMRKSFSTFQSDRNTKFKLQTLQDKLEQIKHSLHNTRQQTKQTIQFSAFIKQILIQKQLATIQKDLKQKIHGLQNLVKSTTNQHKQRSNQLRNVCNNLWNSTQELKHLNFELKMRVQAIQRNMGFKQQ